MWALVDCDNFFCSCERVFRPDLLHTPLVVLSNNDGCVVARSAESKAMGVQMGTPWFQLQDLYRGRGIVAFSSNYVLYADLSARVMATLRTEAPEVYQYSIDESFLHLEGFDPDGIKEWGEKLAAKVRRWVGVPVSIGMAPTKTLAKVAVKYAKKYAGYHKCCRIADEHQRVEALRRLDLDDVWGIGRRISKRLQARGMKTALDFAEADRAWVRKNFGITGERTWQELNGNDVIPLDVLDTPKKSFMTGRSFPEMLTDFEDVRIHVANFASRCALKLRRQHSVCTMLTTFVNSNYFRPDLEQYSGQASWLFPTATASTSELAEAAVTCLKRCFRPGIRYKRAAVMVYGLSGDDAIQADLFSYNPEQAKRLRELGMALDHINRTQGADTIVLASQQFAQKDAEGKNIKYVNAIRRAHKSPDYSTRLDSFTVK